MVSIPVLLRMIDPSTVKSISILGFPELMTMSSAFMGVKPVDQFEPELQSPSPPTQVLDDNMDITAVEVVDAAQTPFVTTAI
jgi:hypothetical protein